MEEVKDFVSARDALAAFEQYQGCFFPHSAAVSIINQLARRCGTGCLWPLDLQTL